MEANFNDEWSSDNKEKPQKKVITKIETPQKHQLYFSKEKRRSKVVIIVQPTRKKYMKGTIIYFSKRYLHKFKIYKYKAIRLSSKNK